MSDAPPDLWLTASQQRSWRSFLLGTTLLLDRLDDELRHAFDLSLMEYEVLVRLSESEGRRLRMAQLADALAHSRSRITHTIKRMEDAGLVQRSRIVEDRRGIVTEMTDAGWDLLVRVAPVHVAGVRRHLVALADEADFLALGRVMDAVADHLVPEHPEREIR